MRIKLMLTAGFIIFWVYSCTQVAPLPGSLRLVDKRSKTHIEVESNLDSQLNNLTNQIITSLSQKQKSKIAVIEFSDLNGNITEFGKYLSEELITRLYRTGKFQVIERHLLNKVIQEHKMSVSGLIDENTAKTFGQILGIDAIATGSITDLGNNVKVNARLIDTETGSIFAVASAKIIKDDAVKNLMRKIPA